MVGKIARLFHLKGHTYVIEAATKPGPLMAGVDSLHIVIRGRQTHGALPWRGVDPIVVASQVVLGLQTVISRQVDLTAAPAVITIGSIQGGVRENIIPDEVQLRLAGV